MCGVICNNHIIVITITTKFSMASMLDNRA